jgi:hypothetical protein
MREDDDLQKVDKELVRKDFTETRGNYIKVGNMLFENFLTIAGF